MANLFCGTSGFAYPSWKPAFYPKEVPAAKFLNFYASRLNCVETNYTFRRLVLPATFEKWMTATPQTFRFLPKAHMKITHVLKLKDAEEFTRAFLGSLEPLKNANRLGPVLFQLAPTFKCDLERLSSFVRLLPHGAQFSFEFRHESWFDEPVYRVLRDSNVGLCLAENEKLETPKVVTADFVYMRLRKPDYTQEELDTVSAQASQHVAESRDVYTIFKHEETPAGALYAERVLAKAFPAKQ